VHQHPPRVLPILLVVLVLAATLALGSGGATRSGAQDATPAPAAGTPAVRPNTVLLRAPIVLPAGPLAVQVARFRFDGGSQVRMDATAGPLALVVETGHLDVEIAGPALHLPPNAPPDAAGEQLVPGQRLSLGPGDQIVAAGLEGLTARNAGSEVAAALVVRFSGGGSSEGIAGTPVASDGVAVTAIIDGELSGLPAGPTSIVLNRHEIDPGGVSGRFGIVVGYGFFGPETGTMAVDLTEGAGTVWQDGMTREIAPAAGADPEVALAPGETLRVAPGTWLTLNNAGPDPLVALGLVVRLPSATSTGTEVPQGAPPEGVTTDRLIEQTLGWQNLPVTVDTVALTRVTLAPGAVATAGNGAHLFVVESGTLTVQDFMRAYVAPTGTPGPVHEDVPAGPAVTYAAGDRFAVASRGGIPPAITNEGSEPAVALVVSIAQTGNITIDGSLPGWSALEPLAVEDAARVGSFLVEAGRLSGSPIAVSLVRASYDEGAGKGPGGELIDEAMIGIDGLVAESGTRLLVVESGAMNYLVVDPSLHRRPGEPPNQRPGMVRLSQIPGDQVLVAAPGRMLTRNVGRGPSVLLIVTLGPVPT
jgi:hypothetical protein